MSNTRQLANKIVLVSLNSAIALEMLIHNSRLLMVMRSLAITVENQVYINNNPNF